MTKILCGANFFWTKIFFQTKNFFCDQIMFSVLNFFSTKIFWYQKMFSDQKLFSDQTFFFWPKSFFWTNFFSKQNFWTKNFCLDQKKILDQKFHVQKNLAKKHICSNRNLSPKICWVQQNFGSKKIQEPLYVLSPPPLPPSTERVKLCWELGRIVWFGLVIHHAKFQPPTMPRSCLKVPGGG